MIITQLNGGLGNQMFQYALGRVLSLKHNIDLYFDISSFDYQPHTDTKRSYELEVFGITGNITNQKLLNKFGKPNKYKVLANRYFNIHLNPYPPNYIRESGHQFQSEILNLPDNTYLSGYWQSEKYFSSIARTIKHDLAGRAKPISSKNKKLTKEIKSINSISLHVRRTDYITNKHTNSYHGLCSLSYYNQAMKMVESHIKSPVYYIFSDDPDWAKENISSKHKIVYISNNHGSDSHEDLRLMSHCKHNIIANSSFSWWGAWLNQNDDKIVIAPKNWVTDVRERRSDLIPSDWIRI